MYTLDSKICKAIDSLHKVPIDQNNQQIVKDLLYTFTCLQKVNLKVILLEKRFGIEHKEEQYELMENSVIVDQTEQQVNEFVPTEVKDWREYLAIQPQSPTQILEDLRGIDRPVNKRLRDECSKLGFSIWRFLRVSEDYYSWSLERRQNVLGAPGTNYLCKSVIMQNTRCTREDCSDWTNSKYYLIVIVR
jgi:hypothetical protein